MDSKNAMRVTAGLFALTLACAAVPLGSGLAAVAAVAMALVVAIWHPRGARVALLVMPLLGCTQLTTRPALQHLQPRALGFTGRLASGDGNGLPRSVAGALDSTSDVVFRYEEKAAQNHSELPALLVVFITGTVHLLGVPMGSDEVTASAELTIVHGSQQIARYEGEARVSRLYGLYYGSTLSTLEDEARTQVRQIIDEALYQKAEQLAAALRAPQP
jgi:hypothetical protein